MIKYEITISFRGTEKAAEIVAAPDIVTALYYGMNKYGCCGRVHVLRYYGAMQPTTTL